MSCLVIFFIATIAVIVPLNVVHSEPHPALDINQILDIVQQQQQISENKQRRPRFRQDSYDSDFDSESELTDLLDSEDSDYNRYARLRKDEIRELIKKAAIEKKKRAKNNNRNIYHKEKQNYRQNNYISRNENQDKIQRNNNIDAQFLEQFLSKSIKDEDRKRRPSDYSKKRIKPNRLLPKYSKLDVNDYYRQGDGNGLEDYSKVYIVLNPQAVRKSKNKNSLNELVSKVLSLSSPLSKRDRQSKDMPHRYKGFVVKDDLMSRRSRMKDSKEIYAPRDSMDDDYKKRSRNGGGGGAGGRTAIPYIKHRGDIYERDD